MWYNNTIDRLQVLTFSHIVVITGRRYLRTNRSLSSPALSAAVALRAAISVTLKLSC